MMTIAYHPAAREEAWQAFLYLALEDEDLAFDFEARLHQALLRISQNPESCRVRRFAVRREIWFGSNVTIQPVGDGGIQGIDFLPVGIPCRGVCSEGFVSRVRLIQQALPPVAFQGGIQHFRHG